MLLYVFSQPGNLRFPDFSDVTTKLKDFSDVTTKLNKHVRDQFASGHPLLDSGDKVASEAVFWTGAQGALGRKRERRARLKEAEAEMLDV